MNLTLFILVNSPYFTGKDELSFLSFNIILFLLLLLQVFLECFNGDDLIFLSSIFFVFFLDSYSILFFVFYYGEWFPKDEKLQHRSHLKNASISRGWFEGSRTTYIYLWNDMGYEECLGWWCEYCVVGNDLHRMRTIMVHEVSKYYTSETN